MRRTASILLIATIGFAISSAASAAAQALPRGVANVEPASSNVIDGVTYYYDANGNPLYYDDPVHYDYPRRFYYRNGGWVMARSGSGHGHSRYANTGLHNRRGRVGQGARAGNGTQVRRGDSRDAATATKTAQGAGTQVRKAEPRGAAGATKAAQSGTAGNAAQKGTRVRAGQGAQIGGGTQARNAGSPGAACATTGGQSGSAGKAGKAASSGQAGKGGKSGSSPGRAGAAGGKHGGSGKVVGSGGSRGRPGPK